MSPLYSSGIHAMQTCESIAQTNVSETTITMPSAEKLTQEFDRRGLFEFALVTHIIDTCAKQKFSLAGVVGLKIQAISAYLAYREQRKNDPDFMDFSHNQKSVKPDFDQYPFYVRDQVEAIFNEIEKEQPQAL